MKIMPTNQWSYTQDEECWDNDFTYSKKEAIKDGKEWYLNESFQVGQIYDVEFTQDDCELIDIAGNIIDKLEDILYEEVGEASEHWSNHISHGDEEDLNARLAKTIVKWIENKVGQPNIFLVDDVETVK